MMKCQERKSESGDLYKAMKAKLLIYRKDGLLAEAVTFCRKTTINGDFVPAPDRIDHRKRQSLVCWFCRNHPEVLHDQFEIDLEPYRVHRVTRKSQKPNTVNQEPENAWDEYPPQESERFRDREPSFLEDFFDQSFSRE
jgi:hypothetical protein